MQQVVWNGNDGEFTTLNNTRFPLHSHEYKYQFWAPRARGPYHHNTVAAAGLHSPPTPREITALQKAVVTLSLSFQPFFISIFPFTELWHHWRFVPTFWKFSVIVWNYLGFSHGSLEFSKILWDSFKILWDSSSFWNVLGDSLRFFKIFFG